MLEKKLTQFYHTKYIWHLLFILLSAFTFYMTLLGRVHLFDWDEINFAESAREMLVSHNFFKVQIDFKQFWEKPPFFFWLQVLSMKMFGINEYAARFPNAVCGLITLLTFYQIGRKHVNEAFGFIWTLIYLGSFLPSLYFKSGIIDPVFNYFIFVSIYFLMLAIKAHGTKKEFKYILFAGLLNGLAILTKGPVGLLILLLSVAVFWLLKRCRPILSWKSLIIFGVAAFITSFAWYGAEIFATGPGFFIDFIKYQIQLFAKPVAGHGEPIYYHFVVVGIGCFPMSILALPRLFKMVKDQELRLLQRWMQIIFWVVMILFTIVTTKIIHYSSMAYLPLSFLAALYIYDRFEKKASIGWALTIVLLIFGLLFATAVTAVPELVYHKAAVIPYIKDPFAVALFKMPVHWNGYEYLIGIGYFIAAVTGILLLKWKRIATGLLVFTLAQSIMIMLVCLEILPKIEAFSQRPAIEFWQSVAHKNCFVTTYDYKSYAQYFYAQVPENHDPHREDVNWLLTGPIDKPVYIATKITSMESLKKYPDVHLIKMVGGFAFYERKPVSEGSGNDPAK